MSRLRELWGARSPGGRGGSADGLFLLLAMSRYNACIHQCFERRTKGAGNMVNGLANNAEMDDSGNCDATVVLLKRGNPGAMPHCGAATGTTGPHRACLPQGAPRPPTPSHWLHPGTG